MDYDSGDEGNVELMYVRLDENESDKFL